MMYIVNSRPREYNELNTRPKVKTYTMYSQREFFTPKLIENKKNQDKYIEI